jgi:lactate dehydrogenase-like 2-hydroxyacid dehydrogenase
MFYRIETYIKGKTVEIILIGNIGTHMNAILHPYRYRIKQIDIHESLCTVL